MNEAPPIRAAVMTVSDRCAAGTAVDASGPAVQAFVREQLAGEVVETVLVADDPDTIERVLREWCAIEASGPRIDLALVTGGTGLGPRDNTPEAATRVIERPHPGLMELARFRSMEASRVNGGAGDPRAFLSRAVAGAAGSTLIVTLPGSPRGATETLLAIADILPHAVRMMRGDKSPHAHRH